VRRLMGYLVRALDFDWSAPAKTTVRRPTGAVSLVTRLGRCCVAPGSRGRAPSGDSWGSQSDGGEGEAGDVSGNARGSAPKRSRGSSRERPGNGHHGGSVGVASGTRRSFGLRRNEDDPNGMGSNAAGRVCIDGSPAALPSVPAQASNSGRRGSNGAVVQPGGSTPPDENYIEIICNDFPVDPEMSLATVRDFVWKKPNAELVLCYRRASRAAMPTSPSPPPPLLPGGNGGSKDQVASSTPTAAVEDRESQDVREPGTAPKE